MKNLAACALLLAIAGCTGQNHPQASGTQSQAPATGNAQQEADDAYRLAQVERFGDLVVRAMRAEYRLVSGYRVGDSANDFQDRPFRDEGPFIVVAIEARNVGTGRLHGSINCLRAIDNDGKEIAEPFEDGNPVVLDGEKRGYVGPGETKTTLVCLKPPNRRAKHFTLRLSPVDSDAEWTLRVDAKEVEGL